MRHTQRVVSPWLTVAVAAGALIVAAPATARACASGPECLLQLGVGKLDPKLEAIVGAGVAASIATAEAISAAREANERPMPDGVITTYDARGKPQLTLSLIPLPDAVPQAGPFREHYSYSDGAFHFNDTAATVAIAAGGAAILASVVAGMLKH